MSDHHEPIPCRLCDAPSHWIFNKDVLGKYNVAYYVCSGCHSLQTEKPYWLAESYAEISLLPDIRALQRVWKNRMTLYYLYRLLGCSSGDKLLDWGGGNGMLVRLLRDLGMDAYRMDTYVSNYYAVGFEYEPETYYKMITAFEVWEHFDEARLEVNNLFRHEPEYLFISTGVYTGQGVEWEYLNAYGRHVFLFSLEGRAYIAKKYKYHLLQKGNYTLFHKNPLPKANRFAIRALLSGRLETLAASVLPWLPDRSALRDQDRAEAIHKFYDLGLVGTVNGP